MFEPLKFFCIYFLFYTENKQIPSDIQDDAIAVQKTLDWDDQGADGIVIQRTLVITTVFVTKDFAVKSNLVI